MMKLRLQNNKVSKSWAIQLTAIILFVYILLAQEHTAVVQDHSYKLGFFAFIAYYAIQLAIQIAIVFVIGALTAKKPPKNKFAPPAGIEQFDVLTAEEGRPIQVLFGKKYITGANVVWYGDLKSTPVIIRA